MNNKYILNAIDQNPDVKIGKDQFEQLKMAKKILSNALDIEKIYEMIISSFIELERESSNADISSRVYGFRDYEDLHFYIQLALNFRLTNLLTTVHSYRDQLLIRAPACAPFDENTESDVKKFFSQEYKTIFEYRFMYALRNHAQHHGFPIRSAEIILKRVGLEDGCDKVIREYFMFFYAEKKELSMNEKFKKEVLKEMPERVNLLVAARTYVEAISRIHEQVREKIKESVESARADMDNVINKYRTAYKEEPHHLCALKYQDRENPSEVSEISIITKWDDVRKRLIIKNEGIVSLSKKLC